jgi:hypothetical protein
MSEATRYVLFYETGPNYPADAVAHFPAHRARWAGFMDRGVLLMIGPFTDGEAGAMGVFKSRETAEEFAGEDPFVLNGVVGKWHVREWRAVSPDG